MVDLSPRAACTADRYFVRMKFTALYPMHHSTYSPEIVDAGYVADFARTAEAAGFDALALTEHPAPSARWLASGGHDALDIFTYLGFCAAVTSRIHLLPYVMVPAFRPAVLGAKQITTLDILSGGRAIIPVGTGYLRSEATALGMSFEERNELLDESVSAWKELWKGDEVSIDGSRFQAAGTLTRPGPIQQPHPPIWVGGNSRRARQRVADYGEGWTPILGGDVLARTTRTAPIPDLPTLGNYVEDLHRRVEHAGRDPETIAVQLQAGGGRVLEDRSPFPPYLDWIADLEAVGVTQLIVEIPAGSASRGIEALQEYGREVIATL
jgi:probable F420-dependent oxidoreductase